MWIVIFFLAIILLIIAYIWWLRDLVLFQPTRDYIWRPEIKYEKVNYEGVTGWYFKNNPSEKTVLYCHGNSGNISWRRVIIDFLNVQGINLLIFDYNGYGKSEGWATQEKLYSSADTMYEFLRKKKGLSGEDIIIWGESLGGPMAAYLAAKHKCSSLVLFATFSSIDDNITTYCSTFGGALSKTCSLIIDTMPTKKWVNLAKCPILIIHSDEDDVIPYENAKRLYSVISHQNKKLIKIKGYHASPVIEEEHLEKAFKFLKLNSEIKGDFEEIQRDFRVNSTVKAPEVSVISDIKKMSID